MATVNLGRIKPVFRGAYNNSTAYVIDDIVTASNETFIAIAATQGNATTDASKWTKLAAKGADGTDVAATLQNKEIAFKTNAGALDGIPIGSAGEFLKVNSGATGYEFGAVSSDFVKLLTYDISSTVSGFNMTGWINSNYKFYKIRAHYKMVSANDYFYVRLINNSGSTVSSNYAWSSVHYYVSGGSAASNDHGSSSTSGWPPSSTNAMGTSYGGQFEMNLAHDNLTAAEHTGCFWTSIHKEQGGQMDGWSAMGFLENTTAFSGASAGINFDRAGSGSFGDGTVTIYGLK